MLCCTALMAVMSAQALWKIATRVANVSKGTVEMGNGVGKSGLPEPEDDELAMVNCMRVSKARWRAIAME